MEYNELEYDSGTLKHDQYCHYENLPRLLKRFSFKEKMRMAALHSSEIIVIFMGRRCKDACLCDSEEEKNYSI